MKFKGSTEIQEFSGLLEGESPRGLAITIAAYFDELLADRLGSGDGESFFVRIKYASKFGLLTENEEQDLQAMRKIRNAFAHKLRINNLDSFQADINGMKTWEVAVAAMPQYAELLPMLRDRLMYVAAVLHHCVSRRSAISRTPLPEPPFWTWLPLTDS